MMRCWSKIELTLRRCLAGCALCVVLACSSLAAAQQDGDAIKTTRLADLAVMNGRIWTGAEGPTAPDIGNEPTSLAIVGDRIVAVGDGRAMLPFIGPGTKIINAAKHRIIPGFSDSHTHIVSGGFKLDRLALRNVRDKAAFIQTIARAVKRTKPGGWLVGGRWSVESWDRPESPTRVWIDAATGDTPVFLLRMDAHQALVNTAALKRAGIDANGPPDPKGGVIVRDPKTHEPTGILKDAAMSLVRRHIPHPSGAQRFAALKRAMGYANQLGITSVHDMSDPDDVPVFIKAARDKSLTVRITSYPQYDGWSSAMEQLPFGSHGPMFRIAGLKGYMDGSLGSRTAFMREPYTDAAPDALYPRGLLTAWADSSAFGSDIAALIGHGLQPAVHAIGDQANHLLLNAYERARASIRRKGAPRPRVEHAQHLLIADIPRFAAVGVVASMQPMHKADDGRYAEKAIGADRLKGSYAYRQLVDSGALLIFGTDWPVVDLDPFAGIDSAVNAKTLDGKIWLTSHSLTVAEAIYAYTVAPTKAIGRDRELGTIEEGKLADLVVLSDDPFTMPEDQLGMIHVKFTVVGGKVVYSAKP